MKYKFIIALGGENIQIFGSCFALASETRAEKVWMFVQAITVYSQY